MTSGSTPLSSGTSHIPTFTHLSYDLYESKPLSSFSFRMQLPPIFPVVLATILDLTQARPRPDLDMNPWEAGLISADNPILGIALAGIEYGESRSVAGYSTDTATLASVGTSREEQWDCLDKYKDFGWRGNRCGGRGWYMKGAGWRDPSNCYEACYNTTSLSILHDQAAAECHTTAGSFQCWMGYHNQNAK